MIPFDEVLRALKKFVWTDDKFVEAFERYVAARRKDGDVEINSEIGWIKFPIPGDYFGADCWWVDQISRSGCKDRFVQIAKNNLKEDDFDGFLMDVIMSNDSRFTELPKHLQEEIAKSKPTGMMDNDTWHEVQFRMGTIMCQVAVVNGKYVALSKNEVNQITGITKIWTEEELRG